MDSFKKLVRYALALGARRSIVKAVGRKRWNVRLKLLLAPLSHSEKFVVLLGCGQFAFSTIAFFLCNRFGECIRTVQDLDPCAAASLAQCYGAPEVITDTHTDFLSPGITLAYIASNHASHTMYALRCLEANIDVYIEKPVAVSKKQLSALREGISSSKSRVFFGYNRPFAPAIIELKAYLSKSPFTLNCVVMGHLIPPEHWYRDPSEGTRVCGNLGHWIDLALHLLRCSGGVRELRVHVTYSNVASPDDDITVTMTTDRGDLITLTLTAREEPFEGINETIVFQQEGLFVKIDDFRRATFLRGSRRHVRRYWPKDVGHRNAIMQPFEGETRDVREVLQTTDVMLEIMELVQNGGSDFNYRLEGAG